MNEAYLCLGGNLGNCIETFTKAVKLLEKHAIRVYKHSSIYISGAWGMEKAPDFYNQVIAIRTNHSAQQLIEYIFEIEKFLGRERNVVIYESRTIDIDVLFFNNEIIKTATLDVPHPRLHLRKFVLEPLNEVAPDLYHPAIKKIIADLLNECEDKSNIKKLTHAF